jgi:hypothetical protein
MILFEAKSGTTGRSSSAIDVPLWRLYTLRVCSSFWRADWALYLADRDPAQGGVRDIAGHTNQPSSGLGSDRPAGSPISNENDSFVAVRTDLEGNLSGCLCTTAVEDASEYGCGRGRYHCGVVGSRLCAADSLGLCMARVCYSARRTMALIGSPHR